MVTVSAYIQEKYHHIEMALARAISFQWPLNCLFLFESLSRLTTKKQSKLCIWPFVLGINQQFGLAAQCKGPTNMDSVSISLYHHEICFSFYLHGLEGMEDDISIIFIFSDVIMGAMVSQITSPHIVYLTTYSSTDQRNLQGRRHWSLCGEFTGEFPAQRASNAENDSIWWRLHVWMKNKCLL